jgi:hypothetical protein
MLALPFEKYIPRILQENIDNYGQALIDYMNDLLEAIKKETVDLKYFYTIELIPPNFLKTLGEQLISDISDDDTDRQKRVKILYGIKNRKFRSTWQDDAKIRIDNITGLDSSLLTSPGLDDFVICGDGLTPPAYYWAAVGCDGIDTGLGISVIGEGVEIEILGNIYIDVGGFISVSIVNQIINNIKNIVPAYFRIMLGYISAGNFILLTTY